MPLGGRRQDIIEVRYCALWISTGHIYLTSRTCGSALYRDRGERTAQRIGAGLADRAVSGWDRTVGCPVGAVCASTGASGGGLPMATTAGRSRATHLRWVPRGEHTVVSVTVHPRRGNEPAPAPGHRAACRPRPWQASSSFSSSCLTDARPASPPSNRRPARDGRCRYPSRFSRRVQWMWTIRQWVSIRRRTWVLRQRVLNWESSAVV